MMKILMLARPNLFDDPGGDTRQIVNTAEELRNLGVEVDLNPASPQYEKYDLLHFFNIIDPEDILGHLQKTDKPYVVSTIYLDYQEYDRHHRKDFIGLANRVLSYHGVEYLKTVGKWILKGEPLSTYSYLWTGHRKSILKIIKGAACLLPNSEIEYRRLARDFNTEKEYVVIPNGVAPNKFKRLPERDRNTVLCVSRIEGRKNHFNLIKALRGTGITLNIVGNAAQNQKNYYRRCREIADDNVHFLGYLSHEELCEHYAKAKVHALPSWFETTGLVSLEAAVMGCNVVVGDRGDVRDYCQDDAWYCEPGDPTSIREAILEAFEAPYCQNLAKRVKSEFNWQNASNLTFMAYQKALHCD